MGNVFAVTKPILHCLMRVMGMTSKLVEIEPGTTLHFWVPTDQTISTIKPAVVLLHGFVANGILTWLFQVISLRTSFAVYVPDQLFFGDSFTHHPERSPNFQVMFGNIKEKVELLEASVVSDKDAASTPNYSQRIYILCGEDDKIFTKPVSDAMKEKLGENATLEYITEAGHLVQIERPFMYNHHLKKFLSYSSDSANM
ncbi:uncharacterized protein LOC132062840 [Lycium ferocissimum]|uniref:uncharacterized protein LOC132062840 n=1 Tax=Lycium ferocissimum TaxID=112874 RepID=UPI00281533A5|nr:uncharacterized protein LOC132062840 [Lycium ferocissimum]